MLKLLGWGPLGREPLCEAFTSWFIASASCCRCRADALLGNSFIWKAAQVTSANCRSCLLNIQSDCLRRSSESSVWSCSFAKACHSARWNKSILMDVLCSSGKRPTNAGIAHCSTSVENRVQTGIFPYLQHIFKVVCSLMCHLHSVRRKPMYTTNPKWWYCQVSVWFVNLRHQYWWHVNVQHTVHSILQRWMGPGHTKCGSGALVHFSTYLIQTHAWGPPQWLEIVRNQVAKGVLWMHSFNIKLYKFITSHKFREDLLVLALARSP